MADFDQAIALAPEDTNNHTWRAFVLRSLNRSAQAEQSIAIALAQPTPDAYTCFGRAAALTLAGEHEQAMTLLQQVMSFEGEFRDELHKCPIFDPLRRLPSYSSLQSEQLSQSP